jgi:hypothetical protein
VGIEMTEKLNIYQKLQKARARLNAANLQKSGKNAFGNGFKYFELKDFMPHVNEIFDELGLIGATDFSNDTIAALYIIDAEDPEKRLVFTCQKAEAGLRQGTPIQNVGAQQTYLRRYLWVQAMELTEDDSVDSLGDDQKITQADQNRQKALPKDVVEAKAWKDSLLNATSISDLASKWELIPPKFKTQDLIVTKDKRKLELTPIAEQIAATTTMENLTAICEKLTSEQQSEHDIAISDKLDEFKLKEMEI